jgi:hypothetical protein
MNIKFAYPAQTLHIAENKHSPEKDSLNPLPEKK